MRVSCGTISPTAPSTSQTLMKRRNVAVMCACAASSTGSIRSLARPANTNSAASTTCRVHRNALRWMSRIKSPRGPSVASVYTSNGPAVNRQTATLSERCGFEYSRWFNFQRAGALTMRSKFLSSALALMMVAAFASEMAAQGGQPGGGAPGVQGGAPGGGGPGGGGQGAGGARGGGGRGFSLPPLLMETDAYPDGGIIPAKYVGAMGVLPAFKISNAPAGTVSYAVIFHDLDVALMGGTGDVLHIMAWNIPASANGWPEGNLPAGSVMGNNLTGQPRYMGPGAPAGPRYHHYVFELYALNSNLDLPAAATRDDLIKAMGGKTTAKAAYVGRFRQGEAPAPAPAGGRQ